MDLAQVCERQKGQETCSFHPGQNVATICMTCGILVCLECITSPEHDGHSFKKLKDCLRDPTEKLAKRINKIEKNIIVAIDKELTTTETLTSERNQKREDKISLLKKRGDHLKTRIDECTAEFGNQFGEDFQKDTQLLETHVVGLQSLRETLVTEKKDCTDVLVNGSDILKYDAGAEVPDTGVEIIPKRPNISDIDITRTHHEDATSLIKEALGISIQIRDASGLPKKSELETKLGNQVFATSLILSGFQNAQAYVSIEPINREIAWAHSRIPYDTLYLITNEGREIYQLPVQEGYPLSILPTTGDLYGGFYKPNTIRRIDFSGKTAIIIHTKTDPDHIKMTKDGHVLVGTDEPPALICKYTITGELLYTSSDKHKVKDIDHCSKTQNIVAACKFEGVVILDTKLNKLYTFTGLKGEERSVFESWTAVFDKHGNIIVGDYNNKEIYMLDGNSYNLIQKLHVDGLSCPIELRLYRNILWIRSRHPGKIMSVELKGDVPVFGVQKA